MKSREQLLTQASDSTQGHDCPYFEHLRSLTERTQGIGSRGIELYRLTDLVSRLETLHQGGNCPPTHIDKYPTSEWEDWLERSAV